MNRQQVLERIHEAGLSRIADDVEALLKPSIRLIAHVSDDAQIPVGASKLGGLPDLPAHVAWPQCKSMSPDETYWIDVQRQGGPLWFLLQVNLTDTASMDSEATLPHAGMLYFFAALWKDGFPMDGITPDCWKVIYYDGDLTSLRRTPVPVIPEGLRNALELESYLSAEFQIKPCTFELEPYYALPAVALHSIGLDERETQIAYDKLYDLTHGKDKEATHLLLGNAQETQSDMGWECESAQPEYASVWDNWHNTSSAEHKQFYANMHNQGEKWCLLLQMDNAPDIGLIWEGYGRGYFWIRKEDLAARNFDRVCLVTQHT